jgi:CheY-like chemotaxis protein
MAAVFTKTRNSPEASSENSYATETKPLALVVEDDKDTRFLLKYLLGMRGWRVLEAEDGEEAVALAESAHPELILMDGSLPRLDGLGATRRMRELSTLSAVPILFLSGHAEPAFRAVAFEAGCDAFLVKPFDIDQLGIALERYVVKKTEATAT